MKKILWFCMLLFVSTLVAQETELHGHVYSVQNNKPMANVHILNLNKVRGTTTNEKGDFTHTKDAITGELKGTTYEYIYDNQNRIIQETSYGTASIELPRERNSYSYDTNGNIETQKIYKWSLFNDEEDGWYLKWVWHHKYNNKRHPTVLETYNAKGENVLNARYEYRYDFNGNYTRKTCYICNVEANKEHLDEIEEREITYY